MTERELLDLLAQGAPVARPSLADDVIRRAQHPRRRRWAITSTCTAVIVIATVPVALTRNWSHSSGRHVPPGSASTSALPANPPVRFVAEAAQHPLGSSTPLGDVVLVTFGPVQITGHRAQVFIQSWCGFNCVQGQTLVLTDRDGVWTVTGTTGPAYIS